MIEGSPWGEAGKIFKKVPQRTSKEYFSFSTCRYNSTSYNNVVGAIVRSWVFIMLHLTVLQVMGSFKG